MFRKCHTLILITVSISLISCNENKATKQNTSAISTFKSGSLEDGYEILHLIFQDQPDIESIKKLADPVLTQHGLDISYKNLETLGSALLGLRQRSAVGVTEMEILKHMYQNGSHDNDFLKQVAISAFYLEQNK